MSTVAFVAASTLMFETPLASCTSILICFGGPAMVAFKTHVGLVCGFVGGFGGGGKTVQWAAPQSVVARSMICLLHGDALQPSLCEWSFWSIPCPPLQPPDDSQLMYISSCCPAVGPFPELEFV